MSVILYRAHGKPCAVCEKPLQYPFVHWEQILLCAPCCGRIRRGLVADMIQVAAAAELQKVYPDSTLVRRSVKPDKIAHLFPQCVCP